MCLSDRDTDTLTISLQSPTHIRASTLVLNLLIANQDKDGGADASDLVLLYMHACACTHLYTHMVTQQLPQTPFQMRICVLSVLPGLFPSLLRILIPGPEGPVWGVTPPCAGAAPWATQSRLSCVIS